MTNLVRNSPRRYRGRPHVSSLPAPTTLGTTLFIGAAVQENNGQLENLTGAGTTFAGFLREQAVGDGTINDRNRAELVDEGEVRLFVDAIGAGTLARADAQAIVYATDGDTFTLDSTGAQAIGKVVEVEDGQHGLAIGWCWVHFKSKSRQVG